MLLYILLSLVIIMLVIYLSFKKLLNDPSYIMKFAKLQKNTNNVSLIINRNGERQISINPNIILPLASTVKIVIAMEYARQISEGIIDQNTIIPKEELDKFHVKGTDGGAHEGWLKHFNNKDNFSLKEIAIGVITFSSNANTEYLLHYLEMDNINSIPKKYGLNYHSNIYPIVSALYISNYVAEQDPTLTKDELLEKIKGLSDKEYVEYTLLIHQHLLNKTSHPYLQKEVKLDLNFQRVWSDRLPASTAEDYLKLMTLINNRELENSIMQKTLEDIMGYGLMASPKNKETFEFAGHKGGSTAFLYTYAAYATDRQANKTEIVLLSNNLNRFQIIKISKNLNSFVQKVLLNTDFTKK